ncbi:MAG: DUF177 domain-containing protein [Flavobacteriales bacterium]|nr:DUF177 domain-containing protein [Flavobacteriales bacterium]
MKTQLKEYRIPFLGLKLGKHNYSFPLTDSFFKAFEYSEIEQANLKVELELEKKASMLVLDFVLGGTVNVMCDRCGDELQQPVEDKQRLIVKMGDTTGSTDDDVLMLGPAEHEVDVSQYLYEYAHLALPAKRVHATLALCNQGVITEFEKYKVETDNDSKWEEIKDLEHAPDYEAEQEEEE